MHLVPSLARSLLASALLLAALPAQSAPAAARGENLFVFACDGPAKLKQEFAATRLGALLGSQRFAQIWRPLDMLVGVGLQRLEQKDVDTRELRELVLGYGGRLRVVGRMFGDADWRFGDPPALGFLISAHADGRTDLAQLARSLTDVIQASDAAIADVRVGEATHPAVVNEQDGGFTLPRLVGDDLVVWCGQPLARVVADLAVDAAPPRSDRDAPIALHLDGRALLTLLLDTPLLASADAEDPDAVGNDDAEDTRALLRELCGADALGDVNVSVRAASDHVVVGCDVQLTGPPIGWLGISIPEQAGPVAALELVPRQSEGWAAGTLRVDRLYDLATRASKLRPGKRVSAEEFAASLEHQTGLRVHEDLFAHLGTEVLAVPGTGTLDALVRGRHDQAGLCIGVSMRNHEAVASALATLLHAFGFAEMFEESEHQGYRVRTWRPNQTTIAYTLSDRMLLVAVGESGVAQLHAVLDRELARRRGGAADDLPEAVRERMALAPAGSDSVARLPLLTLIQAALDASMERQQLSQVAAKMARSLCEGLRENKLEDVVLSARGSEQSLAWRAIW